MNSDLVCLVDEGFNRKSWHGTNLRGSIRRVDARQAVWRPAAGRKCIAEIVVHAAYWKYTVRRKLRGEKRGSFPLKGSNWFALPQPFGEAEWRACIGLLEEQHRELRAAVADQLGLRGKGGLDEKTAHLTRGIAMHDIYHAGQIQTLRALQRG